MAPWDYTCLDWSVLNTADSYSGNRGVLRGCRFHCLNTRLTVIIEKESNYQGGTQTTQTNPTYSVKEKRCNVK